MHLASLEIVGFKSFANNTIIRFHEGVTAIVGPNGCGKSNVLDAIRWTLGEQSAKALRGGQMQDVIFNGTDSRKSTGMAEVSLTFTNCEDSLGTDFNEVRVTRRVFRDGHSEYEINKSACRLRDIQKMFMDTGIGRSSYSIMEQGKIDQILSSKPEERRAIFEEAAGITKFKAQKKEALRKLELTESNLVRVTDIIKEVRRQIGSLQRQAAKARRYKEIYSRLRFLDTRVAVRQYTHFKDALDAAESGVQSVTAELSSLQNDLETGEAELSQKRIDLENLEHSIHNLQQKKNQTENAAERSRQEISFNEQRIRELDGLKERNQADIAALEEKRKIQDEQQNLVQSEVQNAESQLSEVRETLNRQTAELATARETAQSSQSKRSEMERSISRLSEQTASHRSKLEAIEMQNRSFVVRAEKLDEEETILNGRLQELRDKLKTVDESKSSKETQITSGEHRLLEITSSIENSKNLLQERRREHESLQKETTQIHARIEALEQLAATRTGYSEATRMLLDRFQGSALHGPLLDFLTVRPGYERAMQVCLGMAWETLLVKDNESLEQIVAELPGAGQAVLTTRCPEQEQNQPASLESPTPPPPPNAAALFVECDPMVQTWLRRLLRDFYIVDSASEAHALLERLPTANVVSQAGEYWSASGWQIRGQKTDGEHNILEQDNRLRELREQAETAGKNFLEASARLEETQTSLADQETQLAALKTERREIEGELSALIYEHNGLERQLKESEDKLRQVQTERIRLSEQDTRDRELQQNLEHEIESFEQARKEAAGELDSLSGLIQEQTTHAEQCLQHLTETRIAVASNEQRCQILHQQIQSITARLQELSENLDARREESKDYEQRCTTSKETIARAESSIETLKNDLLTLEKDIHEQTESRAGLQAGYGDVERGVKEKRARTAHLQSEKSKVEIVAAENRLHIEALVERIQNSYQVDLTNDSPTPAPQEESPVETSSEDTPAPEVTAESAEAQPSEEPQEEITDWEAAKAEIEELQQKIGRMGPVNIEAITEYEELEERHTFLQKQETDLTESKEQLHQAIRKINQTTRTMFSETFEKIQKNFSEMFRELFGGGQATLTLVNEDDPLESGIDIVARPPGKQLQQISLLSGGEKTMTAVSLLFAIYMVKPSPFCVLDEMDAPLDESNISRFIKILQRFVTQSQFVVITHNKRTISSADVLYGVTMEEHGISKIVSVKLSRKDEDPLFNRDDGHDPSIADAFKESPANA